jgi:NAD(P)-dependent dehydrogenase (short-subunit alcohol dehydrogenase family)
MKTKVALVTGAAMGYKHGGPSIGGAIALRLSQDGFKVVVVDQLTMGNRTVELIQKNGGDALFIKADVTNTQEVKNILEKTVAKFGGLNCLVNCVARYSKGMAKNVATISEDEWNKTLNVNLGGYFKCAKYAIPLILKSGGGTIINISSGAAFTSLPNFSIYSVSKGAINALTRSIAVDFAPRIRCNAICPGFVRIENSQNDRSRKELKTWYTSIAKQYPMKRVCEVEEIANVAAFLASDSSSYINGQSIVVDGGKSIADSHEF